MELARTLAMLLALREGATMDIMQTEDIIYDWNVREQAKRPWDAPIKLLDETLRDGLQSPSVREPTLEEKLDLLHCMNALGIDWCMAGMPSAGEERREEIVQMLNEIGWARLRLRPALLCRTLIEPDVRQAAELVQRTGVPSRVYLFIGSSPIRRWAEGWELQTMCRQTAESIAFAVREGLEVGYGTEDTTRTDPPTVSALFRTAVEAGATSIVIGDTVGHATLDGLSNLYTYLRKLLSDIGRSEVGIEWHGHNDRGLSLALALHAIDLGCTTVHGCALGIGERVGNAPIDQIILNCALRGDWPHDVSGLVDYVRATARATEVPIPDNYPLAGRDAFRTATGIHAAAIIKAQRKGNTELADRIYSSVPAGMFGREQEIEIGCMSGLSNVRYWLQRRDIEPEAGLCDALLETAKSSNTLLAEADIWTFVRRWQSTASA
jgi:2-isopropylmalate synthase